MKTIHLKTKRFFKKILARLPTKLPLGAQEFNEWASDIIFTFNLPDNDSTKWTLAVMSLHLDNSAVLKVGTVVASMPKAYFGVLVTKAMCNQVASQVIQDLKNKQADEAKKAQESAVVAVDGNVL